MQRLAGGASGGGRQHLVLRAYQQQLKKPAAVTMETKQVTINAFAAKSKPNVGSSGVDWQHYLQVSRVSIMKMQHNEAMAEEKRRSKELAKLLKKVTEEKEYWEMVARQMKVRITAMKRAMKQGQQNFITCLSSTDIGDRVVREEVASNFRRNARDEDGEAEPAAKRRKLAG